MYINSGLYYSPTTEKIEGFEYLGNRGRTEREANYALVFMVRGFTCNCKMPIAFYFVSDTCPSDTLAQLIPEVIQELADIGLQVVASVPDQGPTDRGAVGQLRNQNSEGKTDPVYFIKGMKIIHLRDVPN